MKVKCPRCGFTEELESVKYGDSVCCPCGHEYVAGIIAKPRPAPSKGTPAKANIDNKRLPPISKTFIFIAATFMLAILVIPYFLLVSMDDAIYNTVKGLGGTEINKAAAELLPQAGEIQIGKLYHSEMSLMYRGTCTLYTQKIVYGGIFEPSGLIVMQPRYPYDPRLFFVRMPIHEKQRVPSELPKTYLLAIGKRKYEKTNGERMTIVEFQKID